MIMTLALTRAVMQTSRYAVCMVLLAIWSDVSLVAQENINTLERLYQHDRLLRDNNWRTGGGVSYAFPAFDVFASFIQYAGGTDTHAGHAFTAGVSWHFELGGRHRP
jgi:hypothetical protein